MEAPVEGGDLVGSLADEDAFAEKVLIDIRDRPAVDVDRCVAGVEPREERPAARLGRDLDTGLNEGVTAPRSPGRWV